MDDLINDFISETREMLQALECELVAWEIDPEDRARLDSIFRFVHTVKGNCGFLDLPKLQALSHAVEDALNEVRSGRRSADRRLVDAVLAIIDRIGGMVDAIEAGEEPADDTSGELIAALAAAPGTVPAEPKADAGRAAAPLFAATRSIRLPVQLVDRVMSGVSDLVLVRNELERLLLSKLDDPQVETAFNRMSGLLSELRVAIAEARMQPIAALFASFQRKVRDLSSELGKRVQIDIESGQVDLDRELIELIRDPLLHIINNAIDHGIESPAERRAAGKPETGTIMLSARQTGSEVRIGILDDGRGIDTDRIVEKAIGLGLLTRENVADLSPAQRNALIFEAGLSSVDSATRISGRGVGMDIVREAIERLGGSITIETTRGDGCRFLLKVPLTLSIVPVITVRVGSQIFAVPRSYVIEIVKGGAGVEVGAIGGSRQVVVRDVQYPCIGLNESLEIDSEAEASDQTLLMLKMITGRVIALGVDAIDGYGELVVKPIAQHLTPFNLFVGAAQLDDGYPALVIDVAALARQAELIDHSSRDFARHSDADAAQAIDAEMAHLLVFDTWGGDRMGVALAAADRIIKIDPATLRAGPEGTHALLGESVIALAGPTGSLPAAEPFHALLLSDGEDRLAYPAAGRIDTAQVPASDLVGASIVAIEGRIVKILDCHDLFAGLTEHRSTDAKFTCRLPADNRWCREFLKPLVEASGYRVLKDGDAPAALEIRMGDAAEHDDEAAAAGVLTLCQRRAQSDPKRGAIYRYDREAIVEALSAARAGANR